MKNLFNKFVGTFKRSNPNNPNDDPDSPPFKKAKRLSPIQEQRRNLPITSAKAKFLQEVAKNHSTMILIGETGSGKTTQIPQFLHESAPRAKIVVCQPRRVAAISLAKRVAEEMEAEVGGKVGYKVRFEDATDAAETKITFATDGMILREAMLDRGLEKYAWVVLDEAHERTVNTDILFGVVKRALKLRMNKVCFNCFYSEMAIVTFCYICA